MHDVVALVDVVVTCGFVVYGKARSWSAARSGWQVEASSWQRSLVFATVQDQVQTIPPPVMAGLVDSAWRMESNVAAGNTAGASW